MLLNISNIRLSFTDSNKGAFNILNGVNLEVEPGKITALIGGNGAGKTTLFNIISGIEKGYSGDICFEGHNINRLPPYKISLIGIGRLFQGGQLIGNMSLMDNMKIASDDKSGEIPFQSLFNPKYISDREQEKEECALEIITRLFGQNCKYLQMMDHNASSFSYGEQRLLSIARLLMGRKKLLLLDEPTSGVNPVYIQSLETIVKDLVNKEGVTVLLIEHNMHFVRRVADTCAYLEKGIISKMGPTNVVLDDRGIRNSYMGL